MKNLPLELVDKILQYDGRIKYKRGEFINVIHPSDLKFYNNLLNPIIEKKKKIKTSIQYKQHRYYFNPHQDNTEIINEKIEKKFYFEFDFDSLPGVGLSYDYGWNYNYFKISYFDDRVYINEYMPNEIQNIIG